MLSKTKILTISRDQALIDFLQRELRNQNYEVINTRHTGVELNDVIKTEQPEFIILDIVMPGLDGIGICLQLRQFTQLPIMLVSNWDTNGEEIRGLNLCSDSYLTEPFGADILITRIEDTLKRSTTVRTEPIYNIYTYKN